MPWMSTAPPPHPRTSQFTPGTLQQWCGQGCKKCYSLFSREAVQFSYSLLCDFMYKMTKFPFKFQNLIPNTNIPTQWHSHRGSKTLPKVGKKREKIRKKREERKEIGNRGNIGKVLSLCPSWQIGLASLLFLRISFLPWAWWD